MKVDSRKKAYYNKAVKKMTKEKKKFMRYLYA